jgi:TRIAD3 protein (E3 ubiquitin-protein ligase RNF216)
MCNILGKTELKCLDSSGCQFCFPRAEYVRFLPQSILEGYDRLCQEEDLRKAGLSDLVQCPFCDYAAIMTTDPTLDKLFHCQAETCKIISCRLCKKKTHIPLTCEGKSFSLSSFCVVA